MTGGAERIPERADDERADAVRIAKSEFGLGRVDIHVHLLGRQRQEQGQHGVATLRHQIAIGGAHGAGEQLVAHRAPIDGEIKLEAVRPMQRGKAGKAFERDAAALGTHGQRVLDEARPEDAAEPIKPMVEQPGRAGFEAKGRALLAGEAEGDLRPRQRQPLHHVGDGRRLDPLRFHEFEPRRRRIEQVAHLDARSGRERGGLELGLAAGIDGDLVGLVRAISAALDREPSHGADRGQRLAAEAERQDRGEIIASELGGGVALDGERQVVSAHAGAVVGDADQPQAAARRRNVDAARTGIDRILDQLLDDARRPLDDLTRGDAVDEIRRQLTYGHPVPQPARRRDTGG